MVAVVRNYLLNKYHCFKTFLTPYLLFSVLGRDLVSLYPFPYEGNKTGEEVYQFSFLISVPWNSSIEAVILWNELMRNLNMHDHP